MPFEPTEFPDFTAANCRKQASPPSKEDREAGYAIIDKINLASLAGGFAIDVGEIPPALVIWLIDRGFVIDGSRISWDQPLPADTTKPTPL